MKNIDLTVERRKALEFTPIDRDWETK